MKLKKIIAKGLLLIMAETALSAVNITALQKLMAEKAGNPLSENTPSVSHKLSADPAVLVYKDTVYVYATNDAQQAEVSLGKQDNAFNIINTLNVFSTTDLVNWTDCGEIAVAGKQNPKGAAKWANNSWAPAICTKQINGQDKFFLYFADSANGIGVLVGDSPLGPFKDPIGKALISRSTPNTEGVHWLFDPAVLVDDDGKGYLYYGGGVKDDIAHPKSARCVQLGDDMVSIVGTPKEIDAPWLFEDSGINKIGDTYYYSYCSNWSSREGFKPADTVPVAVIAYMTSKNPLGPFEYKGYTFQNPGTYFGPWGNNHHWIFKFNGKHYIAYHAQIIEKRIGFEKGGYRNICIAELKVNADGSLPIQAATKRGINPVVKFNPYKEVPASTCANSKFVAVTSKQTVTAVSEGAYLYIKEANLSTGVSKVTVKTGSENKKGTVKIYKNTMSEANLIAEIKTKGAGTYEAETKISAESSCNLFLCVDNNTELISWQFN